MDPKLLIISPVEFSKGLQPLVVHKDNMGIPTKLEYLSNIYKNIKDGRDEAEKIKLFIKYAKEKWNISYVLLVGGRKSSFFLSKGWWIPVRYAHIADRWSTDPKYDEKYISELYFADLYDSEGNFSSWDTNNDNIFGDWSGNKPADDILNLHPDVYVGRLPCRNRLEVKIMVNKIINYEKEKSDSSWFKKIVVVEGEGKIDGVYYSTEPQTQKIIEGMRGFKHKCLRTSLNTLTGQWDVIREINEGCGFIYFNGHGNPILWQAYSQKGNDSMVTGLDIYHMPFLVNRNKLPVCIVDSCHSSMFDIGFFNSTWTNGMPIRECWSWRVTRKFGGGAIATLGNTGVSHSAVSKLKPSSSGGNEQLTLYFFEEYIKNGTDILGKLWGNAIDKYLNVFPIDWSKNSFDDTAIDAKVVQEWALIGDPSLKIGGYDN